RAVQVAFGASQGPRLAPGAYTVRLTRGTEVVETRLKIGLDTRAPYTAADRKAHFDAAMRAHALFGEMSELADRIQVASEAAAARTKALPADDELGARLKGVMDKLAGARTKIVATKEGGHITGEERIREHLDILYGALMAWEGRPTAYQLAR